MMALTEPKPVAALGATLLARKGGAKPAMRPQLAAAAQAPEAFAQDLEDLGWNDMGAEDSEQRETSVLTLTPPPHHHDEIAAEAPDEPEVLRQQRSIAHAIVHDGKPEQSNAPVRSKMIADSRRAAFTLRLDARRHLKLRLASTVKGRSAQVLVTQALDKYLAEIPEIEALAAQLKRD